MKFRLIIQVLVEPKAAFKHLKYDIVDAWNLIQTSYFCNSSAFQNCKDQMQFG